MLGMETSLSYKMVCLFHALGCRNICNAEHEITHFSERKQMCNAGHEITQLYEVSKSPKIDKKPWVIVQLSSRYLRVFENICRQGHETKKIFL